MRTAAQHLGETHTDFQVDRKFNSLTRISVWLRTFPGPTFGRLFRTFLSKRYFFGLLLARRRFGKSVTCDDVRISKRSKIGITRRRVLRALALRGESSTEQTAGSSWCGVKNITGVLINYLLLQFLSRGQKRNGPSGTM